MKITKKLAAITAAIVMSVSTMAISASAYPVKKEFTNKNSYVSLKTTITDDSTYQQDYATGTNLTSTSRYLVVQEKVYEIKSGQSQNYLTNTCIKSQSKSGTPGKNGEVSPDSILLYKADWYNPYARNTATLYNGTVVASGQYASVNDGAGYLYSVYF